MDATGHQPLPDDRPRELKRLINDYWWVSHLLDHEDKKAEIPGVLLAGWLEDIKDELEHEHGLTAEEVEAELAAAGIAISDPAEPPYEEVFEENGGAAMREAFGAEG